MSDEIRPVLQKLGLTELQAKVYLALATNANLRVDEIAKQSKVHRPDIYRLVKILEEKGLVERVIANPVRYRALPLDKAFDFLLRKRSNESVDLLIKTRNISRNFKVDTNQLPALDLPTIIVIPRARVVERIGSAIDNAIANIDLILSRSQFESRMFYLANRYISAWDRGISMRIILDAPKAREDDFRRLGLCMKSPRCELKFIPNPPLHQRKYSTITKSISMKKFQEDYWIHQFYSPIIQVY
jgi:sugar-specific transcriptional regulator TrmB